jgi:hypothetical protein
MGVRIVLRGMDRGALVCAAPAQGAEAPWSFEPENRLLPVLVVDHARNSAHAEIMDELVESLLLAVLREHGKSFVDIRQELRIHIADFERLVRSAALPDSNDPYKCERAVQEFRVRFRERVEREASQSNDNTATLHQALQILEEDRSTGLWPIE